MAAAAPAAPPAPGEAKRPEGDEWCDSGLGSLGEGPLGQPLPDSPGPEPPESPADPSAWLRHVLSFVTEDGDTALHLAVIHEHEEFLESILRHTERSPYLDLQNDLGQSALHIAVVLGLAGAVGRLRAAGAGLCVRERGGHTPLHLACREGHPACARALLGGLLEVAPEPRQPPETPPEPQGTARTPPEHQKEDEELRAQLESVNYDGYTPLHVAVLRRDLELVQLLLRAGADPDRPEPSCGRSPLHLAVEAQSPEVAECLLRGGARPDPRTFSGYTPLYSARRRPDPRLPPLLRRFGARDPPSDSDSDDSDSEGGAEDSEEEYDDIVINSGRCPD
ncbi:LOW QUALITY PROTEIN: NF-kappa-B inhibitor beta-like [Corapipo altera]|uniref:LOW QUALITY PROTEIN: NF-kappa-B inhibitor beta-like n=1 Tax=Corapipo altera TaxID=415028 RepID=UPI000FD6B637|nr:LOW QUALITY PROTEIN: NF-kappa-B inhibitor beta-like [Corapipo altera]